MNNIHVNLMSYFNSNTWVVKIALVLLLGVAISWFANIVYSRIRPRLEKSARSWDESLLKAIHRPFLTLVWLLVFTALLPIFSHELKLGQLFAAYVAQMRQLIFIFALVWFVMRFIKNVEKVVMTRPTKGGQRRDVTSVRAVAQLMRIVVVILALLISMQALGVHIATLLAFGGVGGIALGFAAKDILANFFGGMMIFFDRPFSVGDWIRSPDRNIEGTVEYIGWRLTRIRTFDKRPLYVPNAIFSTVAVENPSRMTNRRIKTTIGLRYNDATKIDTILTDIESMLKNHPEIDTGQTLMVNLIEFGPSSLNFFIYTFTKTTNWVKFQAVQQDVFLKTIAIITSHGAECAFPTSTLHIPEGLLIKEEERVHGK